MSLEKIVVVKKATALEELLRRHATRSQVQFYLASRGESYDDYLAAHTAYELGLKNVLSKIGAAARLQIVDKNYLPTFQFSEKDLVVVVGDPGLFVNAAKYVGEQPAIVINPDPTRICDVFTSCTLAAFPSLLKKTLANESAIDQLTMAKAQLNDGQTLLALNDFYIGAKTHISARYEIEHKGYRERQSSSGIIVSTGTGSTGWLTSIMTGAYHLTHVQEKETSYAFARDASFLQFCVREPFPSKTTGTTLVHGTITQETPLRISSTMPENGVLFSDGVEADYLPFTSGCVATITLAEKKAHLVKS